MVGERRTDQGALFYEFSLERRVPADRPLRAIDRFVDLADQRVRLAPFYSERRPGAFPNCPSAGSYQPLLANDRHLQRGLLAE